MQRLNSS